MHVERYRGGKGMCVLGNVVLAVQELGVGVGGGRLWGKRGGDEDDGGEWGFHDIEASSKGRSENREEEEEEEDEGASDEEEDDEKEEEEDDVEVGFQTLISNGSGRCAHIDDEDDDDKDGSSLERGAGTRGNNRDSADDSGSEQDSRTAMLGGKRRVTKQEMGHSGRKHANAVFGQIDGAAMPGAGWVGSKRRK